jgi:hypothetical protein
MSETTVRIGLPLPLDVMGNIASAIGQFYPTSQARMGYNTFDVIIDDSERVEDIETLVEAKKFASEFDLNARFEGMSDDAIRLKMPEWFSKTMVGTARQMFDDNPDAVNSLEMEVLATVKNEETQQDEVHKYVVIVAKSQGQTPTAMRFAAEAEVERLTAELAQVREELQTAESNLEALGF